MKNVERINEDEFDVFEIFHLVKKNYHLYIIPMLISTICTYAYFNNLPDKYYASIKFEIINDPLILNEDIIFKRFEDEFLIEENFIQWKLQNPDSKLPFDIISEVKIIDGSLFQKNKDEKNIYFAKVNSKFNYKKMNSYTCKIFLQEKNNAYISDVYKYSDYVNSLLTEKVKKEIEVLNKSINKTFIDKFNYNDLLGINLFINLVNKKQEIFKISQPTYLENLKTKPYKYVPLSVVLTFMFVTSYVFLKTLRKK